MTGDAGTRRDGQSVEDIERDLAATRAQFEHTLDLLADRLDVKARATAWSRSAAETVTSRVSAFRQERPREFRAALVAAGLASATLLVRRVTRS